MKTSHDMKHETGYLDTQGARIHYQRWLPKVMDNVMVVAHGLGEHSGRYKNLVNHFVPKGFGVFAIDHRGHGLSSGIRGHVQSFLEYRDDLASFIDRVREETGFEKIVLVGHSMGAVIATSYSLLHPEKISRLILSSPGLRPYKLPSKIKETVAKGLARVLPTFLLSNELDPSHVSRDADVVKAYVDDPLVHDRVSPKFYVEFVKETARLIRESPRLTVPLFLMQAGEDRLVHTGTNQEFFSKAGSPRKEWKVYEGHYHEIFNEPERDQVFADMEVWLGSDPSASPGTTQRAKPGIRGSGEKPVSGKNAGAGGKKAGLRATASTGKKAARAAGGKGGRPTRRKKKQK
jgi:acylglycerol lipase